MKLWLTLHAERAAPVVSNLSTAEIIGGFTKN
jgi:hypothetical protein